MQNLVHKKPKRCIIGGLLSIIPAIIGIILLSLLLFSIDYNFFPQNYIADFVEITLYYYAFLASVLIGGVLIYTEKNRLGGAMSIFFGIVCVIYSILISPMLFIIMILPVIGGVVSVFKTSPKNIDKKILNSVEMAGRINIRELSESLGITEADAELSIINLKDKGTQIYFDKKTRTISIHNIS